MTSSLVSIAKSAARMLEDDEVRQTVIELGRGHLLVMSVRDGSCLAALASRDAEIGVVGYEMAKLAKQAGDALNPAVRAELQRSLPQLSSA